MAEETAPPKAAPKAPSKPPATMAATPWEGVLAQQLKTQFGESIIQTASYLGQNFAIVKPQALAAVVAWLRGVADFDYLVDITAVDWPKRAERFDLVYILYSFSRNERLRLKTAIAEDYRPQSLAAVHLTANWLEREVFDMFGIEFTGHPDLRRILLPEDWQGHPLRKDYTILEQDQHWVQSHLGIESGQ
jgi:NADH-quinone oxidoreductase subunit C